MVKWLVGSSVLLLLLLLGPAFNLVSGEARLDRDWRSASRERVRLAPDPASYQPAVVQVYAARAFGWRGAFGVHTWVAVKPQDAEDYTVHQVMGWHVRHGGDAVVSRRGEPDRRWYGQPPRVLAELRGDVAARVIDKLDRLIADYPYRERYVMWPGPNSNTFTAYLGRQLPELGLDLPASAIGKDYLVGEGLLARSISGQGHQVSLMGLLGVSLAPTAVELNVLGLSVGVALDPPALKLPGAWNIPLR